MDASKGIHALGILVFTLMLTYVSRPFVTTYFGTYSDTVFVSALWGSYIIQILIGIIVLPALLSFSEDTDASIVSLLKGFAFWGGGVMFCSAFFYVVQRFVGTVTITQLLNNGLPVQLMSFIWLLAIVITMYIGPIMIATMPNMVTNK